MHKDIIARFASKTREFCFEGKLMKEIGVNKATARAIIELFLDVIEKWFGRSRSPHQIIKTVVSISEPPGKPIKYCEKLDVCITVDHPYDAEIFAEQGAVAARKVKCFRYSWEVYEQKGAASVEDLSCFLTVDPSTVKGYIRELESLGLFVPTRGRLKDIGRVPSHKETIGTLLARGYTYTRISAMTAHSERSIERYALDFGRVICLADKGACYDDIRIVTDLSTSALNTYLGLYEKYNDEVHREHLDRLKRRYELVGDDEPVTGGTQAKRIAKKNKDRMEQRSVLHAIRQRIQEYLGITPHIALIMATEIMSLVKESVLPRERLLPGQTVVMADAGLACPVSGERYPDRQLTPVTLSVNTGDKLKIWQSDLPSWEKLGRIADALSREINQQGGVVTISQLAFYLHVSESRVSNALRRLENKLIEKTPIKGFIEDTGPTLSHKQEIIELEDMGYTPPEISERTRHTPASRDRYLVNFHKLKVLERVLKQVPDEVRLSRFLGCTRSVANQYLKVRKKLFECNRENVQTEQMVPAPCGI